MERKQIVEMIGWIDQMFEINSPLGGEGILQEYEKEIGGVIKEYNYKRIDIGDKVKHLNHVNLYGQVVNLKATVKWNRTGNHTDEELDNLG